MEIIGWIGGILLSLCGVPQAWKSYKDGHSEGLSLYFILMWFFGEIFLLIYVFPKYLIPLILNYSFNVFIALVIVWYKIYPRKMN